MWAIQTDPAHPWTVAALASTAGVSRAALARRFTELVAQPPMAFVTDWRLSLAADRLREGDETLAAVARGVGYGGPFALSTAFKRRFGVSPRTVPPRTHDGQRRRRPALTQPEPKGRYAGWRGTC